MGEGGYHVAVLVFAIGAVAAWPLLILLGILLGIFLLLLISRIVTVVVVVVSWFRAQSVNIQ